MADQATVDNGLGTGRHPKCNRRRWSLAARRARCGQSLVEFSLVIPLFILLVLAIFAFGLVFQNKIAMDNAVRDGARFASTQPDKWDNTKPNASQNSIQGQVQRSGGTAVVPNQDPSSSSDGQGIKVEYFDPSGVKCGSYDYSADDLASIPPYTKPTCLTPGNLVTVSATIKYNVPVPLISAIVSKFFSGGLPIQSSATMTLEQGCSC
jgi:Flp pilus assembly protein TadG